MPATRNIKERRLMDRFAFTDLVRAFQDGERFGEDVVRVHEVGSLVLPTGAIVACDPTYLRLKPEPAFTRRVQPGSYPVLLSLLSQGQPDCSYDTVACASVRFRDAPVKRWELALRPGWDVTTLKPGHFFGYGVDGGAGCFVDELAVAHLAPAQRQFCDALNALTQWSHAAFLAAMPAALRVLDRSTDSRASPGCARSGVIDPETGANLVSFTSGMGDGLYPSYFGLAADGFAVCLVTDFGLLVRSVTARLELPVPVKRRSELTHPDLPLVGIEKIRVTWDSERRRITIRTGDAPYLESLRFENRPGQGLACTMQGDKYWYDLAEPLQPAARLLLEYTLRTEAL
jgi:hypothetical protein